MSSEVTASGERDQPAGLLRVSPAVRTLAPLGLYLILSFSFLDNNVNLSEYYYGYSTDSLLFVWFLHWWPFALTHGLNPFLSNYAWFPTGYNFAWATSIPFYALLMWPVTSLGGPVLSYNILALSMPAFSAWTAYLLARDFTKNFAPALICGLLFGFSMPEMYQAGELNIGSIFFIPLAVLLCARRLQGRLGRKTFVILLSLLLAAQLGMSTEVLAMLCLMGALSWAIFLLFAPAAARPAFWRLAVDIALAAPLTLCLTAPFIYYLIQGLPQIEGNIHETYFQSAELLYFFVPTVPVKSAAAALHGILRLLRGYSPDFYTYISLPVLLILIAYVTRHIGKPYIKALAGVMVLSAVLSLGTTLLINGHDTKMPLPWMVFAHVPVIGSIISGRLVVFLTLGAGLVVALWLDEADNIVSSSWRYGVALLACLFLPPAKVQLLPDPWVIQPLFQEQTELKWTRWPTHPFFTPGHIRQALGPKPNVLILPDPVISPGMAWQVESDMGFTQAAGYVGVRLKRDQKWMRLDDLIRGAVMPDFRTFFPALCAARRVDYVLIGPGTPPNVTSAIEALGWPHRMDEGIEIITVPKT